MRDLEINGLTGEEETRRQYEYIEKARQYVAQKEKEAGRKLTCCVHTFGCQRCFIFSLLNSPKPLISRGFPSFPTSSRMVSC